MREFRYPKIWVVGLFALITGSVAPAQIFTTSNVSTEATSPVQHGSSIIELDDGSLLVSFVPFCFSEVLRRNAIGNLGRENYQKGSFAHRGQGVQPSHIRGR